MNTHFLTSTVLPVCVLAGLAIALPLWITPRDTRSQRRLMVSVVWSAIVLLIIGAVFMAVLYAAEGTNVGHVVASSPINAMLFFAGRSALASLIWLPLLALSWFSMAQKVERLKGKDGIRMGLNRKSAQAQPSDAGGLDVIPDAPTPPQE